jgi:hypothetical protein
MEKNILGVRKALILGFILHLRHDRWITKTMDREYIYIFQTHWLEDKMLGKSGIIVA